MSKHHDTPLDVLTRPKFSVAIFLFQICMVTLSVFLSRVGEYELAVIATVLLWTAVLVQLIRVHKAITESIQILDDSIEAQLDIIAKRHYDREGHKAETVKLLKLLKEDVEQARKRDG